MANGVAIDGEAVYVASHEKMFKLYAHFFKPEKISPSKLYRIDLNNNQKEQVFYNR